MSEQPDLTQIMQQVGSRGMVTKEENPDLTQAMQQSGHRGWPRAKSEAPNP